MSRRLARRAVAIAVAGVVHLLAACGPLPAQKQPPLQTVRDFALLSTLGDESGLKITAVDHFPLDRLAATGARPVNAPAGLHSGMGVWLKPGFRLLHVQYARNIASGISLTQGNVRVAVAAGHTYIVRPFVTSDFGKVSFSLIDHGTAFPVRCLPASIRQTLAQDARGERKAFTRADLFDCLQRTPR